MKSKFQTKYQRTRRGVLVPDEVHDNTMACLYAIMRDLSRCFKRLKHSPDNKIFMGLMERSLLRTMKDIHRMRVELGSCPSSVWRAAAKNEEGDSHAMFMSWPNAGSEGVVR